VFYESAPVENDVENINLEGKSNVFVGANE
jgi:hypothetical protein